MYAIGTKVRLTAPDSALHMIGAEGVVVGYHGDRYTVDYPKFEAHDGTTEWYSAHRQITPIQGYDGNEKCEWNDCVWQPEKEVVDA
jgi:hypothetical protein